MFTHTICTHYLLYIMYIACCCFPLYPWSPGWGWHRYWASLFSFCHCSHVTAISTTCHHSYPSLSFCTPPNPTKSVYTQSSYLHRGLPLLLLPFTLTLSITALFVNHSPSIQSMCATHFYQLLTSFLSSTPTSSLNPCILPCLLFSLPQCFHPVYSHKLVLSLVSFPPSP